MAEYISCYSRNTSLTQSRLVAFQGLLNEDLDAFQITTFGDVDAAITAIQVDQAARKSLRNMNKMKPTILDRHRSVRWCKTHSTGLYMSLFECTEILDCIVF
jgi:hypothetical protein